MTDQADSEPRIVAGELAPISLHARIPPFWRENPRLWFAQFEAVVATRKLGDEQKYNLVIPVLERTDIEQVSDIILNPPTTNKYDRLKERLVSVYQESEHKQLQKLLSGLELGDQKPTHLLRRMRELGGTKFPDDALKVIWMTQMPSQIRAVLSVNTEASLEVLATMADKIIEHTEPLSISVVSSAASTPHSSSNVADTQFELLSKQIEKLSLEIAELRVTSTDRYRYPTRTNSGYRSRSRTPSRKPGDPDWQCKYHFRFGERARRCESPCSRKNQKN